MQIYLIWEIDPEASSLIGIYDNLDCAIYETKKIYKEECKLDNDIFSNEDFIHYAKFVVCEYNINENISYNNYKKPLFKIGGELIKGNKNEL